ncbi:glyoxalase [Acidobacteria bacterium AB60]|nr:glyoxalase [Acidobacteria bacterium AB60]
MAETKPSTIMPALRYRDAHAAIDWFCNVLGFTRHAVYDGPDNTVAHAELTLNGGMIMLGSQKDDEYGRRFKTPLEAGGIETCSAYVVVEDADAVYARAQAAGAPIVRPIQDTDYGSREFTIKDPEGHSWSVGTYNPWAAHS